jgi:homocysteine S-methyltransferase
MKTMEQLLFNGTYLSDGGMETTFVFHDGIELNHFASFELLLDGEGRMHLREYFRQYLELAKKYQSNFILETPTGGQSPDWCYKLGYSIQELRQINIRCRAIPERAKK